MSMAAQGELSNLNYKVMNNGFTGELLDNKEYRRELAWSYLKNVLVDYENTDLHLVQAAVNEVL